MTRRRALLATAGFGLCLLVPLFQGNYHVHVLFHVALFAALGLAWNLVGGYAGQLALGNAAFFGIGSYALPLFHDKLGIPLGLVLVLLIVFIAQNTQSVKVSFLGWDGHAPLAVALLLSAAAAMVVTAVAGTLRILQLRRRVGRENRKSR